MLLTAVAYTVWLERKVIAHIQNRWGPYARRPIRAAAAAGRRHQVLVKEDLTPPHVNKPLFIAAPLIAVICALTSISVIPFGTAITVCGYTFRCSSPTSTSACCSSSASPRWACTASRWPVGRRTTSIRCWAACAASAQMISYEICLGLSLVGVLIVSGSFSLREIVEAQSGHFWGFIPKWNIFYGCQFVALLHLPDGGVSRKPTAFRSICRKPKPNWSPASTPNTAHEVRHVLHGGVRQHDHGCVRWPTPAVSCGGTGSWRRFVLRPLDGSLQVDSCLIVLVRAPKSFLCFSFHLSSGCAARCRASATTS